MATAYDKENIAPLESVGLTRDASKSPSPRKSTRRGRSKSIGPGALEEDEIKEQSSKDRRKSAFIPATRSILSRNEDAEKAARRRTMVNRRVSFAPEATLHTWDVIELARDQTTSTESSSESTRRNSGFARSGSESPSASSDNESVSSPKKSRDANTRRSTVASPFDEPEDMSLSGISDASDSGDDAEGDEDDEDEDDEDEESESGDDTGTAMSLDMDNVTSASFAHSEESTSSSARLDAALQQAARTAGTRGIEFDEFGDMSMEFTTVAPTPAAQGTGRTADKVLDSASYDQENINPFLQNGGSISEKDIHAATASDDGADGDADDVSMDVTRAVGRITRGRGADLLSSPFNETTMEFTQAVGKITGQKRQRGTKDNGSPARGSNHSQVKRRRSSAAESSDGDTMEMTVAVGGIAKSSSSRRVSTRRLVTRRRSSGVMSNASDMSMEMTRAVGAINQSSEGGEEVDADENLSMELTTVMGESAGDDDITAQSMATLPEPNTPQKQLITEQKHDSKSPQSNSVTPQSSIRQGKSPRSTSRKSPARPESTNSANTQGQQDILSSSTGSRPTDTVSTTPLGTPSHSRSLLPAKTPSPARTPTRSSPQRRSARNTKSPAKVADNLPAMSSLVVPDLNAIAIPSTPEKTVLKEQSRPDNVKLSETIKLMSTPRKETLKISSPIKATPMKQISPARLHTPRARSTPKVVKDDVPSPIKRLRANVEQLQAAETLAEPIGLQDFLDKAGIRFMDLTTTKRRMTAVPTPSKNRNSRDSATSESSEAIDLEQAIVAAACTIPELELYQHACHEIKRYTKEGKQTINALEAAARKEIPPLVQAYMNAPPESRATLDAQMREMKTSARLRSKEMWYAWRSQDLGELMRGLQKIGEGLIADDETLSRKEQDLDAMLPPLVERQSTLQEEVIKLEEVAFAIPDDEKEELYAARDDLVSVNAELAAKQQLVQLLRKQAEEQDVLAEQLEENKTEFLGAIQEANRAREACRGVSTDEMAKLKASLAQLESDSGWTITSATAAPSTVTLTYRSELELFLHPTTFQQTHQTHDHDSPNTPIRLNYIGDSPLNHTKPLTTTLRFFLQLLRASLHAIQQSQTRISDLLSFLSHGWDVATQLAETERRVDIEAPTHARIVGDEKLEVESTILLPRVRSKVRVVFGVLARVTPALELLTSVSARVEVVYGELYNEKNMTEFLNGQIEGRLEGWDRGLRVLKEKLVARGEKGGERRR